MRHSQLRSLELSRYRLPAVVSTSANALRDAVVASPVDDVGPSVAPARTTSRVRGHQRNSGRSGTKHVISRRPTVKALPDRPRKRREVFDSTVEAATRWQAALPRGSTTRLRSNATAPTATKPTRARPHGSMRIQAKSCSAGRQGSLSHQRSLRSVGKRSNARTSSL